MLKQTQRYVAAIRERLNALDASSALHKISADLAEIKRINAQQSLIVDDGLYDLKALAIGRLMPGVDPKFIATALRDWLERLDVKTLYIEPGSPWENGYCESFN